MPASAYPALLAVLMGAHDRPAGPSGASARSPSWASSRAGWSQADLVILGGLNEGASPPALESGPWLNRAMRRQLGPAAGRAGDRHRGARLPDRRLRARGGAQPRRQGRDGAPTVASRWLSRLRGGARRAGGAASRVAAGARWAAGRRRSTRRSARRGRCARPEPRPPLAARPRELWATDVERLMRDPYAVYARRILKLRPLEPLDADPGGAERGQIIHAALEEFVRAWPDALPETRWPSCSRSGAAISRRLAARPQVGAFWWPRFERVAAWFGEVEQRRRAEVGAGRAASSGARSSSPAPGGPFRLRARADRVEIGRDGSLGIVDYKTGPLPTQRRGAQRPVAPARDRGDDRRERRLRTDWRRPRRRCCCSCSSRAASPPPATEQDPVGARRSAAAARRGAPTGSRGCSPISTIRPRPISPVPRPEIAPAFTTTTIWPASPSGCGTEAAP